jgi:formamidopyrimidine-DNA glycosylase
MPELPDVVVYIERLADRVQGQPLVTARLNSPFVLRTVQPPLAALVGHEVRGLRRIGKQIVFEFDADLFLVVHLMIAGRFHWKPVGAKTGGKIVLGRFDFPTGTLTLTEASTRKRAALHVVEGEAALAAFDRGGIEVLDADVDRFAAALRRENHTVKRSLTDPRLFSGIGNAYSDEILHRARMSPLRLTAKMDDAEIAGLQAATRVTLREWIDILRRETGTGFPEKVTAFRPGMAVHGRYRQPCPDCGAPVQRIAYAENECNYCAVCQTGGRLLADRALSRLLREDWPRTLEELEERRGAARSLPAASDDAAPPD